MQTSITGNLNKSRNSGFTLFELLVVLSLLGIIAVFVVPRLGGVSGGGPEVVRRFVRGAMGQGRTLAKLTRSKVFIEFERKAVRLDGKKKMNLPDSARFRELILAGEDGDSEKRLLINRRGIAPSAIIRFETDEGLYSFLVSPVLNNVEYRSGPAGFEDFAE